MGAEAHLTAGQRRWLAPVALWSGILAGPVAWALDLTMSYALVKWVCLTRHDDVLHGITIGAFVLVCAGALLSWRAMEQSFQAGPTDGGRPVQRARFMAILGLATCALFGLQIIAGAIPRWFIDACQ